MKNNQQGFGVVGIVLVLVVAGLLVFASWWYMNARDDVEETNNETVTSEEVPEINEEEDLETAESFLEGTDVDQELDTTELDEAFDE